AHDPRRTGPCDDRTVLLHLSAGPAVVRHGLRQRGSRRAVCRCADVDRLAAPAASLVGLRSVSRGFVSSLLPLGALPLLIPPLLLSALLLSNEILIVPQYALMSQLGLIGTQVPLVIEPVFGVPAIVGTFLMRQFFVSLPRDLEDAGRVDGLGLFGVFFRIAMP